MDGTFGRLSASQVTLGGNSQGREVEIRATLNVIPRQAFLHIVGYLLPRTRACYLEVRSVRYLGLGSPPLLIDRCTRPVDRPSPRPRRMSWARSQGHGRRRGVAFVEAQWRNFRRLPMVMASSKTHSCTPEAQEDKNQPRDWEVL